MAVPGVTRMFTSTWSPEAMERSGAATVSRVTSSARTAAGMTRTLANIEQLTAHDADLAWQLSGSLTEVGKAAAAVRRLADYLEQNPNALLFGQGKEEP